ncbi:MAG: PhzF family phenazine biosynthesis protein [Anaerolineae bacterium]|nr:PhzF family phenazine biosynthesis protein [Anaerolineae bacterium]
MILPFMQVDAFTATPLQGNPCVVVFDADELAAAQMLAIAREMNLSETAFVLPSERADVRARYFTPAEEIPLAGHPTIATLYALVESGRLPLPGGVSTVQLELEAGVIPVDVEVAGGKVRRVTMAQLAPRFLATYDAENVLPAFGLDPADALPGAPLQTVSTGTPQLMVPLRHQEALRRAAIDPAPYRALKARADFFSAHLFCLQGFTPAGHTSARHPGLPPEPAEDPFTGSATGNMGAYLWYHGLLDDPRFVAEQGHWFGRPGQATVEVVGSRAAIATVRVGGEAVAVAWGELRI